MAVKAGGGRLPGLAATYEKSSEELERRADVIRNLLVGDAWKSEPEEASIAASGAGKSSGPPARKKR